MKRLLTSTVLAAALAVASVPAAFADGFLITAIVNQDTPIRVLINIDGDEGVQVMDFHEFVKLNNLSGNVTPDTIIRAGNEVKLEV